MLSGLVLVIQQYLILALADLHITLVPAVVLSITSSGLIAIIILHRLFKIINGLEKIQIKKYGDPTSAKIITRVLKIVISLSIVLLFGEHFGMSLSGLLAFGGIGGIAIGLASKDILSNFFQALFYILIDHSISEIG